MEMIVKIRTSCTEQDAIAACQTNANATSGQFRTDGTAACFKGSTFTFAMDVPSDSAGNVSKEALLITEEENGEQVVKTFASAKMESGKLKIDFGV